MNLIGNNCVSSFLYKDNGLEFSTPFIWGGFDFVDFIYLLNNYDNIDFNNISFSFEHRFDNKELSVLCNIDNKINYHFSHYCYDENKKIPDKIKGRVFYKDIIKYTKEKYLTRLKRVKENPVFLFSFNLIDKNDKKYEEYLNRLLEIKDKKLIILIHESISIDKKYDKNIQIIKIEDDKLSTLYANIVSKEVLKRNIII